MNKKAKKIIWITLLSVIGAVVLFSLVATIFIKNYYSQENALKRMFSLRAEMKLEEYYDCFDIPENSKSYMNSIEAYLLLAKEKNWGKIDSFEISQKRTNTYNVKYGDQTETLELIKQNQKNVFGFDTYKIKIESVTAPILYVVTHKNADVTVDGVQVESAKVNENDVDDAYLLVSDENTEGLLSVSEVARNTPIGYFESYDELYDNYCFTNAFDREYKINISTDYTTPFETTVTPSDIPYILRDLKLSDETEAQIKDLGENFMIKYYYALQNGDDFSSVSNMITTDQEKRSFFESDYEELLYLFTRGEETEGIVDICFLGSTSTVNYPGMYSTNQQEYTVISTLDYSYNSITYDGYLDKYEYHNDVFDSATFTVSCIQENGKWVVSNVDDTLINTVS